MTTLHTLLIQQMTRKEFLLNFGVILLTLLGVMKLFESIGYHTEERKGGYGEIPYDR